MEDRVFTDEQLAEMGMRTIEKALDAIDAGDKERAKEMVELMYAQFTRHHDGYMTWVTGLLTYIYECYGIEVVEKAERFAHEKEAQLVFLPPDKVDFKSTVERMAKGLHGHVHQHMTLIEDDEKLVITNTPCGSGGRLIQMGAYEPEVGMAKIKEKCALTFDTEDFPIYCVHCPLFNMNGYDSTGDFIFVNDPPPADGSSCRFTFYKDKHDIPEEYYRRLGKEKPQ